MEVQHRRRRRQQGVPAVLGRHSGVAGSPEEHRVILGRGQGSAGIDAEGQFSVGTHRHMGPQHIVHALQMALVHQGLGAPDALLGGLEQQLEGAVKHVPMGGQDRGHAESDGRVPVVAAGVHDAGVLRPEALAHRDPVRLVKFRQRQGVDVKPQGHRGPRAAAGARPPRR